MWNSNRVKVNQIENHTWIPFVECLLFYILMCVDPFFICSVMDLTFYNSFLCILNDERNTPRRLTLHVIDFIITLHNNNLSHFLLLFCSSKCQTKAHVLLAFKSTIPFKLTQDIVYGLFCQTVVLPRKKLNTQLSHLCQVAKFKVDIKSLEIWFHKIYYRCTYFSYCSFSAR